MLQDSLPPKTDSKPHIWSLSFNFRYSSRKSQSQHKPANRITHFILQFSLKNITHFTNLNSLNFPANIFNWLVSEKAFALHLFWTTKNCILEALRTCKQMSLYSCIYILVYFRKKIFLPGSGGREGVVRRLDNFLKVARCLGLVKCLKNFYFNRNFWKFNYF